MAFKIGDKVKFIIFQPICASKKAIDFANSDDSIGEIIDNIFGYSVRVRFKGFHPSHPYNHETLVDINWLKLTENCKPQNHPLTKIFR